MVLPSSQSAREAAFCGANGMLQRKESVRASSDPCVWKDVQSGLQGRRQLLSQRRWWFSENQWGHGGYEEGGGPVLKSLRSYRTQFRLNREGSGSAEQKWELMADEWTSLQYGRWEMWLCQWGLCPHPGLGSTAEWSVLLAAGGEDLLSRVAHTPKYICLVSSWVTSISRHSLMTGKVAFSSPRAMEKISFGISKEIHSRH